MYASGLQDVVLLLLCISRLGGLQGVGVCLSASLQLLTKKMLPILSSRGVAVVDTRSKPGK